MTEPMQQVDQRLRALVSCAGSSSTEADARQEAAQLRRSLLSLSVLAGRRSADRSLACDQWTDHEFADGRTVATGHDGSGNWRLMVTRCNRCGHESRAMERPEAPSAALPTDERSWQGGQK